MSTTLSKKHLNLQLRSKSPPPLGPSMKPVFVVLSATELPFPHLKYFKFQPKKGMRPMTKERIHKIAMISLAVFPVINSLYLEKTKQRFISSKCWQFWMCLSQNRSSEYSAAILDKHFNNVAKMPTECKHEFNFISCVCCDLIVYVNHFMIRLFAHVPLMTVTCLHLYFIFSEKSKVNCYSVWLVFCDFKKT